MSEPLTTMGPAADTPYPETRVQCGSRRVELEVEDYAASYTGFEDGRDTKSRRETVDMCMKAPVKRLSSSVRPRRTLCSCPPPLLLNLRLDSSLDRGGLQETSILYGECWRVDWFRITLLSSQNAPR